MRVGNTRRAALAVASVAVAALVLASGSAAEASPPPPPSASSGLIQNRVIPAAIAQVPMTDQHGQTVTLASLQGKTLMIVPSLTLCTDICPMTTGNLVQVHHALVRAGVASKVAIVEVSVDPVRDTVARLAAYAQLTGADWYLTTETPANLAELATYFGFYYQQVPEDDPPSDRLAHPPATHLRHRPFRRVRARHARWPHGLLQLRRPCLPRHAAAQTASLLVGRGSGPPEAPSPARLDAGHCPDRTGLDPRQAASRLLLRRPTGRLPPAGSVRPESTESDALTAEQARSVRPASL